MFATKRNKAPRHNQQHKYKRKETDTWKDEGDQLIPKLELTVLLFLVGSVFEQLLTGCRGPFRFTPCQSAYFLNDRIVILRMFFLYVGFQA